MFSNKEKIGMVIGGIVLIGTTVAGVYNYGKLKFVEGRISKHDELRPIIKALSDELKDVLNK